MQFFSDDQQEKQVYECCCLVCFSDMTDRNQLVPYFKQQITGKFLQ
jgi:hypothetical protein